MKPTCAAEGDQRRPAVQRDGRLWRAAATHAAGVALLQDGLEVRDLVGLRDGGAGGHLDVHSLSGRRVAEP